MNVLTEEIYPADVAIWGGRIMAVGDVTAYRGPETEIIDASGHYLCPGLIDGHLHIECSKLSMTSFAEAVVPLGTTSIVSGLDQILVVGGLPAARAFLDEAAATPLKIFWGAPCRTPYTLPRSHVGHYFGPAEHAEGQLWPECVGVWETVREFIDTGEPDVMAAIDLAQKNRLPVLGCSPMCRGRSLNAFMQAGIHADHESYTAEEALEKLRAGLHVLIRESSISHFLEENLRIVTEFGITATRRISFCTDDVVAADLRARGHVDNMVRMAIAMGVTPMAAIQMATINGAEMVRMDGQVGVIAPGRAADILLVRDLLDFRAAKVIAKGRLVAVDGRMLEALPRPVRQGPLMQSFKLSPVAPQDFRVAAATAGDTARVLTLEVDPTQIFVRRRRDVTLPVVDGAVLADPTQDVQYITVVERYGRSANRPTGFVSGFGMKSGAIASSLSPDDNNIICIGTDPADMALAINHIIEGQGGQAVVQHGKIIAALSLPIGGIVSDLPAAEMEAQEGMLDEAARLLGCALPWPFMYMFVMQVTAIPDYAITDLGIVDCIGLRIVDPVLA